MTFHEKLSHKTNWVKDFFEHVCLTTKPHVIKMAMRAFTIFIESVTVILNVGGLINKQGEAEGIFQFGFW